MAVDFEISSLSGTGTATIRVKPKAVNTEQTLKEQVLKVVVQGVEREVTLIQKAAPKIVETWGTYFSITPETTSHTFDGTKRGETLEIWVYSYQQKFIDNEPQDEYRAIDWKLESSSDWLEVTQEIGEAANAAGKLIIKTKSTNQDHNPSNYDPLERTTTVKIISQQEPNPEIVLNITQSPGIRTTKYGFEPTPNIPFPNPDQNTSTAQISNVKGYQYYLINGIQVAKFVKQFKITDISKTIEGQFPGGIGLEPIPFKVWLTDYPSNIATQWVSELNCVGHLQTIMSGFGGIQVTYNGYINANGNQSVPLNIRLGL
jgi:hypothetical protein